MPSEREISERILEEARILYGYEPTTDVIGPDGNIRNVHHLHDHLSKVIQEKPQTIKVFSVPLYVNRYILHSKKFYTRVPQGEHTFHNEIYEFMDGDIWVTFTGVLGSLERSSSLLNRIRGRGSRIPAVQGRGQFSFWNGVSTNPENAKQELINIIKQQLNIQDRPDLLVYIREPNPISVYAYVFPDDNTEDSLEVKFQRWITRYPWGPFMPRTWVPSRSRVNRSAVRTVNVIPETFMNIPSGTTNAITMDEIQDGAQLADFQDESTHGRYYLKSTVDMLRFNRGSYKNPFTRERFGKRNIRIYTARVQAPTSGGKRRKTKKSSLKNKNK